jgi:hypothetical protein
MESSVQFFEANVEIGCHARKRGVRVAIRSQWEAGSLLPKDEDGNVLANEEDKTRFLGAMVWDHVFCPFQCELCQFRNLQG